MPARTRRVALASARQARGNPLEAEVHCLVMGPPAAVVAVRPVEVLVGPGVVLEDREHAQTREQFPSIATRRRIPPSQRSPQSLVGACSGSSVVEPPHTPITIASDHGRESRVDFKAGRTWPEYARGRDRSTSGSHILQPPAHREAAVSDRDPTGAVSRQPAHNHWSTVSTHVYGDRHAWQVQITPPSIRSLSAGLRHHPEPAPRGSPFHA